MTSNKEPSFAHHLPTADCRLPTAHCPLPTAHWLWPFLLSRLWVGCFVYLGHMQRPFLAPVPDGWEGVPHWWLNPWTTYDSRIFLRIAAHGYDPTLTGTFPFYPLLLRLAGPNQVAMACWGVVLSNAAFALALCLFYRLTKRDYNERVARLATWLLAFFPTAAVFSAVYGESVFLLLVVATFLCVREGRWAWAGWWALLAALTRNSGPVLFVALGLEWLHNSRSAGRRAPLWTLIPVVLPLLGFVAVQGYYAVTFHGLLAGVSSHQIYGRQPGWPWLPIGKDIINLVTLRGFDVVTLLNVAATLAAFWLVWRHWKEQPRSYSLFIIGIMMMHLTYGRVAPPHTNGSVRFLSTTFPFVQLLGVHAATLLNNRFRLTVIALAYGFIGATISFLFGFKWFVHG